MKHIFNTYLKLEFKTDGKSVWWWSSNHKEWFPDANVKPENIEKMLSLGIAYIKAA
ncbi:TPA: hypothetical protein ACS54F_003570 [Salmonella enterica]|uniref:hypothetical protein n=1 Tax=Salmonella enterica TaxID=28901 RepID=UPI0002D26755|nr:hypothetical protein [Salmonella enterica]EHO1179083.1 hypothetical protein [Salmonella enterica subsp. enterica serovar Stanleyville]EHQ8522948.1 hypothetical protein [Salmonella enterica subsp. enterica serovar Typhi]EHQ9072151.1 hypothetical protein [Salmonella enterica subsp. enterica serovar Oranienburg]EIC6414982.1 hypothetical protein [Salmonella enterica subsp. enterica serovar Typhimurium]EJM1947349.1 hypothetical protein [Salmonella enterica subsp. enterica serovar Braenderup]MBJ